MDFEANLNQSCNQIWKPREIEGRDMHGEREVVMMRLIDRKLENLAENERNVISVISKADFKSLRILAEAV
eukprot:1336713-Amorphochlora_amoeboformis.AAC.1